MTSSQGSCNTTQALSDVFYEHDIKKGSELLLRKSEVEQFLQQDNRRSKQEHSEVHQIQQHDYLQRDLKQQLQQHYQHQQKELLKHGVKIESYTPSEQSAVTTSSSVKNNTEQVALSDRSDNDVNQLIQSERSHLCMTCFKGFRNKPQLTQHELVHNNIRKHVCSYCEKTFKQVCHLNQHIRVHTGERPYKCEIEGCGRSFAQLSNLNHHKKNHEEHVKRDVSRQFRCEVCERSYATKHSLNTHIIKLHSNVKVRDGPISNQYESMSKSKKKRKNQYSDSFHQNDTNTLECDCDKDGPPTQVKIRSSFASSQQHSNDQIGMLSGIGDKDKEKLVSPFLLPFTSNQSQSSPISVGSQPSQCQQDFVTTYSGTQSQGHRMAMQSQQQPNIFSSMNQDIEQSHSNITHVSDKQMLHSSLINLSSSDEQADERKNIDQFSKSESIVTNQRDIKQSTISNRDTLSYIHSTSNFHHPQHSQVLSQFHSFSPANIMKTDKVAMCNNTVSGQSDYPPSHVTHHFP